MPFRFRRHISLYQGFRRNSSGGKKDNSHDYLKRLTNEIGDIGPRIYYPLSELKKIRATLPALKIGVFTRAPRSYAQAVLQLAYPEFAWDILIAFEDVSPTKPYGNGIQKAMTHFNIQYLDRVALIGDNDADVRSAYNAGCFAGLDRTNWDRQWKKWEWGQWHALELIPDAIINAPEEVLEFLQSPLSFLPELERSLEGGKKRGGYRFDEIGHFIPKSFDGDHSRCPIHIAGRSFANYKSTSERSKWHKLTASISENKESDTFPIEWVDTVRAFVMNKYMFRNKDVKVSVVPHRPGRKARLENFLAQLEASFQEKPIVGVKVSFHPDLFAYKPGVKSQHNDHLGQDERFANVRDHLYVQTPQVITPNAAFIVIDDVTTTGASLVYALQYLKAAKAADVKCLSMAKNVGKLYYDQ